jgi:nitrogen-specific signal transduction histidine kinase
MMTAKKQRRVLENVKKSSSVTKSVSWETPAITSALAETAAHEIRDSLNIIEGCRYLISDIIRKEEGGISKDGERICKHLETLQEEKDRCVMIIQELCRLTPQPGIDLEPVEPEDLLEKSFFFPKFERAGHKIHRNRQTGIPDILADCGKLAEAFSNIARFVLQSIQDDAPLHVSISHAPDEERLVFEFRYKSVINFTGTEAERETGTGEKGNPFSVSQKVDKTTGLGLIISHNIIHRHKGSMEIMGRNLNEAVLRIKLSTS